MRDDFKSDAIDISLDYFEDEPYDSLNLVNEQIQLNQTISQTEDRESGMITKPIIGCDNNVEYKDTNNKFSITGRQNSSFDQSGMISTSVTCTGEPFLDYQMPPRRDST